MRQREYNLALENIKNDGISGTQGYGDSEFERESSDKRSKRISDARE